ncbi:flagellar basal body rod protein FlgB [Endozoicomonas sp. OPT23]|uniref:flagellar basal body rod protein FlgB n=1 Tax=Endozoicomonas sp. OPT23 TaxID=2072845 RepID=UPI00129B135E|nr:flagellar basal body rod protein FlgB [Endozoicomonas sp. OPT23]MRI33933.1 flagellar basal body rod protein FlgB [Endozoicomonas sp. OPT23]
MAISIDGALGVLPATLQFRASRAEVIAGNISNMETPGYKARDLNFKQVFEQQINQSSDTEAAAGMRSNKLVLPGSESIVTAAYERDAEGKAVDGNSVELGYEQAAFMRNRMAFETSFTFLNMKLKGLERAING